MSVLVDSLPAGDGMQVAFSAAADTAVAIGQVLDSLRAESAALTLVFFAPSHDASVVAEVLRHRTGLRGLGFSTAGELSNEGFSQGTMVGMCLRGNHVRAASSIMPRLSEVSLLPVTGIAHDLARRIGRAPEELDPARHAWVLFFDGLSGQEDFLTPYFARHAPRIPIVGGSFADGENFTQATLVNDGRSHSGAGCVTLLEYDRPFEMIHHTHMEFTDRWFEVTDTAEGGRILLALDGKPALDVYAEALGIEVGQLTTDHTGRHPFGFRFKGRPFPCSVMQHLADGLLLAYSVQPGDRLSVLAPGDMLESSRTTMLDAMTRLRERGGKPQGALLFNCLGRFLEARAEDVVEPLFEALHQLPLCGMNTYGEQFAARHMNHSLTGIMFG